VSRSVTAISASMIVASALFFITYPLTVAPRFATLFADFGNTDLPFITVLALKPITSIAALLFLLGGTAAGIARPRERAIIFSLTGGGGVALAIAYFVALYAPIFTLAERIK
jgi:hypothetical protein